jgi:hypothetical protein
MQTSVRLAAAAVVSMLASQPALTCRVTNELNLPDVKNADVVVVGRITEYEVIRDKAYYAKLTVRVEEALIGNAKQTFTARWDNSTFALPDKMDQGPFLIALRTPSLETSASATMPKKLPHNPDLMTVVQAPCSRAFIFESASDEARIIRDILALDQK